MSWLQLSIDTSEQQAPLLELVFENLGALSVTLGDARDQPLLELPPDSQQLWDQTRVTALFEGSQDPQALRSAPVRLTFPRNRSACWPPASEAPA